MDDIVSTQSTQQDQVKALRETLNRQLAQSRDRHFGNVQETYIKFAEDYFWDETKQDARIQDLVRHGFLPGKSDILDVAAGCGQFLFRALEMGYNCYGIEPEQWKLDFIREKTRVMNRPQEWSARVLKAFGENLPFPDNSFDCVNSVQTLEHVQSPERVIAELVRVVKPGGGINLHCPDYRSTFEGHYKLPWLPLFPRILAKKYLALLKRPSAGLDSICYVTRPRIMDWIRQAEQGKRFLVFDEYRLAFENALRRRGLLWAAPAYPGFRAMQCVRSIGRSEMDIHIFLRIVKK